MNRLNALRILLPAACIPWVAACKREGGGEARPLVVGMDATYRPFEYVDEKGEITGVSVEIGREIGKQLGREVEFRNINFDGLILALKTGAIDLIISSMTANEERRKSIAFSDPYVKTGLSVLVAKGSPVGSAEDLKGGGRRLAVRIGTTGEAWCAEHLPEAALVRLDTDAACVLEVVNGRVDAWVYDQISVMNYHAQHQEQTRALLAPLREEFWAVGMAKEADPALAAGVNAALKRMREEGAFGKIADKLLSSERELMRKQGLPFVFELEP
jgi:polar amino acid transport system substrate-binding protein